MYIESTDVINVSHTEYSPRDLAVIDIEAYHIARAELSLAQGAICRTFDTSEESGKYLAELRGAQKGLRDRARAAVGVLAAGDCGKLALLGRELMGEASAGSVRERLDQLTI